MPSQPLVIAKKKLGRAQANQDRRGHCALTPPGSDAANPGIPKQPSHPTEEEVQDV